ncbi:MAG: ATP synthase F1 subunit epsilon [Deltaproteobacteria bacterium]|nr:ATP synthase F1 subunit epsilon [Deltaproteobacteria bacterium]
MAETFLLEVVTPDRLLLSEEVEEMTAPGGEGEFGVLLGHAHFLTSLKEGELTYRKGGNAGRIPIKWGYAEIGPTKVTILAETETT